MTREKVIKALELSASLAWNSNEGQCEIMDSDDALTVAHAIRDALELLKEQEPVEPTMTDFIHCGCCDEIICITDKYCSNCGRKVKWDAAD